MTGRTEPGRSQTGRRLQLAGLGLVAVGLLLPWVALSSAQQVYREGFERETVWVQGTADAAFRENRHRVTEDHAHGGQRSEHIQIEAQPGSFIHYHLDIGRAPVTDELNISVWIKANRPGAQLLARLVLPQERNPQRPDEPLTVVVRGDLYQLAGRWQRLELRRPVKLLKEQQQLLRVELKRDIAIDDAYIDRVLLNVYGGPGLNEIWIDDLEAGPVLEAPSSRPPARPTARDGVLTPRRAAVVQLNRDQLVVSGKKFFFRGVRHTGAPLKVLRDAGFNTIWFDEDTTAAVLEEAANLGFWVVPTLTSVLKDQHLTSSEALARTMSHFLERDEILFWDLGGGLQAEQVTALARTAQLVRAADTRPLAADVWDGFQPYSRNVDLLGVHRWPLMTGLELTQYREWLNQRRLLAQPGTFFWTWVQTHTPEWYAALLAPDRAPGARQDTLTSTSNRAATGATEPALVGPQPEQVRLVTYLALAAGCRGLGFWADRFSADPAGRDRLLNLALLNQELQMLEPLLVTAEPPLWIDTSLPQVKAALMRTDHGILVLPIWVGAGSQCVPGQAATVNLTITVPQVPNGAQVWEVTPGEVRSLRAERVTGGVKVTIPEFGLTTAIVFTSDTGPTGLLVRFQDQARRLRKLAAQWSHDLAQVELEKVARVNAELEQAGRRLPDGAALLENARARLQTCARQFDNGDYREAYREAQRALRPLRILMRAHWEQAVRDLNALGRPSLPVIRMQGPDGPDERRGPRKNPPEEKEDYPRDTEAAVASPYAMSFFTLPRHWELFEQVRRSTPSANVLPGGDFETPPDETPHAWLAQPVNLDEVELTARRVSSQPHSGKQCLMLQIKPKNREQPPAALERTFLAIHSPAVRLEPGSLVQVSGWVRIPAPITASADGALLYDSAGGEPLAVRLTEPTGWKKFTLYRRVPADGTISLTVALTGLGTVYFDDLQIEPLVPAAVPREVVNTPFDQPRNRPTAPDAGRKKAPPPRRRGG
ncbi:MAG TPA: hypothetical protein VNK04_11385 [Gemmataceae bacterium]|nr:hypothetical protein [Gemmataceae bacterium]